jgi:oligopeptide transport system substrate-binding protein
MPNSACKNLRLNFTNQIATLDPRKSSDPCSSAVIFMLYQGLTRYDADCKIEPALASQILISEDQKTYTFILKETYWSNGVKLVAKDFERTWKDILSPLFPAPNAPLFYPIKNAKRAKNGDISVDKVGIKAIDDSTLVVELEHPTPYFLSLVSFCSFFPVYDKYKDQIDKDWNGIVSNGPFQVAHYQYQSELSLKKNELYFKNELRKIDQITISFVSSEMTAFEMFNKKELDLVGLRFSAIPEDIIPLVKNIKAVANPSTTFCSYNLKNPLFSNLYLRKALDQAINKEALIDSVAHGFGVKATGFLRYSHDEKAPFLDYFEIALNQMNLSKETFPKLTLLCLANRKNIKAAEILSEQLTNAFGITICIEPLQMSHYLEKLYKRDYQFAICEAISQYDDPSSLLSRFENADNPKNYPAWEDKVFIDLMIQASNCASFETRFSLYLKADERIKEEVPISTLYHADEIYLKADNLKGMLVSPIGSIHFDEASL